MKYTNKYILPLACRGILAVLVATWTNATLAAEISLRAHATPRGTVVRLRDVADVRAENNKDAERLAALPLMPAPASGTLRYLRLREVQDMLAAHGENSLRLTFSGEQVVEIGRAEPQTQRAENPSASASPSTSASQARRQDVWLNSGASPGEAVQLSDSRADELRDQLSRLIVELLNRNSGQKSNWQVKVKATDRDLQTLASAKSGWTCSGGAEPWTGRQRFTFSLSATSGDIQLVVPADVTLTESVVVATRPIGRGALVTAADVELQQTDNLPAAQGRHVALDSIDMLVGMETARAIQAGQTIFADDVRSPLLVKRGDEVVVYARGGGIQVRTRARAKQDGARGELVQVESLETREVYDAVVVGQREAAVFAGNVTSTGNIATQTQRKTRK